MRIAKRSWSVGLLAVVVSATPALANHNHPKTATKMRMSLVRAFQQCASLSCNDAAGSSPNTQNITTNTPACSPSAEYSTGFDLGPKGSGRIIMSVKKSRTAEDLKLDVLITDVRDSGNLPYTSGADCEAVGANCLQLNFFYRLTDHNCLVAGDCTAIDGVPLNLSTGHVPRIPCKNGTCKLITTVNTQIPGTITPGKEGNLEIRDVVIEDPSNNPFVKPGLFFP